MRRARWKKSGSFLVYSPLAGAICHCILRLIFRQKASFIKLRCDTEPFCISENREIFLLNITIRRAPNADHITSIPGIYTAARGNNGNNIRRKCIMLIKDAMEVHTLIYFG